MCYHYSLTKKHTDLMELVAAEWEMPFEPIYHATGFDHPAMPVVTTEAPDRVQAYHWGLIPPWVKTFDEAARLRPQTLNARAETLFSKPAFRTHTGNRCIALADGFYEWMHQRGKKYPHYVQYRGGEVFGFAGLYSHWADRETGELFRTFTLITTAANPFMARIHNTKERMPVLLPQSDWNRWLQPNLPREEVERMLQPCADAGFESRTISSRITDKRLSPNTPEVLEAFDYPELGGDDAPRSTQASLF